MTQEIVSGLLGVHRESLTEAAGKLQNAGCYLRYRRGHISVLAAEGRKARACECYGAVSNEFRRPHATPTQVGGGSQLCAGEQTSGAR